jgi:hypothetical protein
VAGLTTVRNLPAPAGSQASAPLPESAPEQELDAAALDQIASSGTAMSLEVNMVLKPEFANNFFPALWQPIITTTQASGESPRPEDADAVPADEERHNAAEESATERPGQDLVAAVALVPAESEDSEDANLASDAAPRPASARAEHLSTKGNTHAPSPLGFWDQVATHHARGTDLQTPGQAQVYAAVEHVALHLEQARAAEGPAPKNAKDSKDASNVNRAPDLVEVLESLLGLVETPLPAATAQLLAFGDATSQAEWRQRAQQAVASHATLRNATLLSTLGRRG